MKDNNKWTIKAFCPRGKLGINLLLLAITNAQFTNKISAATTAAQALVNKIVEIKTMYYSFTFCHIMNEGTTE